MQRSDRIIPSQKIYASEREGRKNFLRPAMHAPCMAGQLVGHLNELEQSRGVLRRTLEFHGPCLEIVRAHTEGRGTRRTSPKWQKWFVLFLIQTKAKHNPYRRSPPTVMSPPAFGKILNKLKHLGPPRAGPSADLGDTATDEQVYRYRKQRGVNLGKESVFMH